MKRILFHLLLLFSVLQLYAQEDTTKIELDSSSVASAADSSKLNVDSVQLDQADNKPVQDTTIVIKDSTTQTLIDSTQTANQNVAAKDTNSKVNGQDSVIANAVDSTSQDTSSNTAKVETIEPPATPVISTAVDDSITQVIEQLSFGVPDEPTGTLGLFDAEIKPIKDKYQLVVTAKDEGSGNINRKVHGTYPFTIGKDKLNIPFKEGVAVHLLDKVPNTLYVQHDNGKKQLTRFMRFRKDKANNIRTGSLPLWLAIIPPLIAIALALLFREVIAALFLGIWSGAFILNGFSFRGLGTSFLEVIDKYILGAMADTDHLSVIIFSLLIGGMVAIISKNGGMAGVVASLSGLAKSARSSQLVTWFLGVAIFFDDYANTLIVGNTARSLTDKYRISREKLAYIVDSTAAPVAAVALITTWIGAELGYIGDARVEMGIKESPYSIFLNSLAYSYYPFFTLAFILLLALFKRDFGPMLKAERRARSTGQLVSPSSLADTSGASMEELAPLEWIKHRPINAVLPILSVIVATIIGLIYTGYDANNWDANAGFFTNLSTIIGNSNSYVALLWSSLFGVFVATFITLAGRLMSLRACMDSLLNGIKAMIPAMVILVLAWSLAQITKDLHTADYLTSLLEGRLDPNYLPMITFLLAGLIAFSTGSSWSTMAILYPIILPLSWAVCDAAGVPKEQTMNIFYNVTSCVLAGSVFGDHCSPISDTTILSSLASNCNHIDHVRTQLPYAVVVATVSVGMGTLAAYNYFPVMLNFLVGLGILFLVVIILGRRVPDYDPNEEASKALNEEDLSTS